MGSSFDNTGSFQLSATSQPVMYVKSEERGKEVEHYVWEVFIGPAPGVVHVCHIVRIKKNNVTGFCSVGHYLTLPRLLL